MGQIILTILSRFLRILTEKKYDKDLDKKEDIIWTNTTANEENPHLEPLCITSMAHTQGSLSVFSYCFPAQPGFLLERRYILHMTELSFAHNLISNVFIWSHVCHVVMSVLQSDTAELSHFTGINLFEQPEGTQIHLKINQYVQSHVERVSYKKCHSGLSCRLWFQDLAETPE